MRQKFGGSGGGGRRRRRSGVPGYDIRYSIAYISEYNKEMGSISTPSTHKMDLRTRFHTTSYQIS